MNKLPNISRRDLEKRRRVRAGASGVMLCGAALVGGAHIAPELLDAPAVAQQSANRSGRLQLTFQPDGSLRGLVGSYQPVFDLIRSISFAGGLRTGIDCAGELKTLSRLAAGIPDPNTG